MSEHPKPPFLRSLLTLKCPRCRRGPVFKHKNAYKRLNVNYWLDSYEDCVCCGLVYKQEPGFWFGTSYVSYTLMVLVSAGSFSLWWLTIGINLEDMRIFYWLIFNAILLFAIQPYMMRLSRIVFLTLFVKYDPHFDKEPPKKIF